MKILFHSYNTCFQNPSGGIQIRMKKIKSLLENNGITVDFFNPTSTKIVDYDILHIFKLNVESIGLIDNAKKLGKKVVISSIVNLVNKRRIAFCMKILNQLPLPTVYKQLSNIICQTDLFIAETNREKNFLAKYYLVKPEKIKVLPNGIDFCSQENDFEIFNYIGKKCKYILQVGRINKNKNTLNAIKAIGPTNIDFVIIGGPDKINGYEYYQQCLNEASKYPNIYFIGWVDSKSSLLQSAYKNAEVLILPSYQESFGLTLLEGGMFGAKLAISNTLPILDYHIFDICRTFNPYDVVDMRKQILLAYNDCKNHEFSQKLIKYFSWDSIIREQINYYEDLLNEKNNN